MPDLPDTGFLSAVGLMTGKSALNGFSVDISLPLNLRLNTG